MRLGITDKQIAEEVKRAILEADIGGNLLAVEELESFIITTINQSVLLPSVRIELMDRPKKRLDLLGMEPRQTREPSEATAVTDKGTLTHDYNELSCKETVIDLPISYRSIRRNIEGKSVLDTIDGLAQMRFGNDLEDMALNCDTATDPGDPDYKFLKQNDGWNKLAKDGARSTHKVNTNGVTSRKAIFQSMLDALPQKWDGQENLAIICSRTDQRAYRRELSVQVGGLPYIIDKEANKCEDIPIIKTPKMPAGTYMYTPTTNLAFGIEVAIEKEMDKDIQARVVIIVYAASVDQEFVLDDAVVIAYDQGA